MKSTPFFIATAVSTVLQGLVVLVTTVIGYFAASSAFDQLSDPQTWSSPLIYGLGGMSCIGCLAFPIIYMVTGWLYTYLHQREGTISLENGALGGGLSSGLAGLITGIFSGLVSIVLTPLIYQNTLSNQIPPDLNFPFQTINTITTSFGSIFSACWSAVLAGGLGAIGGLIGGAIYSKQSRL